MEPLTCQRDLFDLDDNVTFLNGAYMSPQLRSVEEAGRIGLSRKNRPHQIAINDFFEPVDRVKALFAKLVQCDNPNRIAIIPSASYGLATVAKNLPLTKQQNKILVLPEQFPSNYYSWERLTQDRGAILVTIETTGEDGPTQAVLNAIDSSTACVTLAHVHWSQGTKLDLKAIRERTREVGAWLIIDGTQSVGALPFSVQEIQPEALICAAYKWLMGPYSIGLAYYSDAMDNGVPVEENWINRKNSHDFRGLVQYQPDYKEHAARYCMGEQSNFVLLPMLEAALRQINEWRPERIQAYCRKLNAPFLKELEELGFSVAVERAEHLLGVGLPKGVVIEDVQSQLTKAGILVGFRGSFIRISPHVYNDSKDWERLMQVLRHFNTPGE